MCIRMDNIVDRPEVTLAHHIEECLGVHIEPDVLLTFLTENWRTVSMLAHRIHDNHVRRQRAEQALGNMTGGINA